MITQIRLSEQALDLSLTTAKIADLAVTTAKINDLAVTTAKINAGAVTMDKVSEFRASAGSGLTLNVAAGKVRLDNAISTYAGGTLSLTDDATNYVEVNSSGTVSFNTTGFTAGRYPIAQVTTVSGAITVVTDKRALVEIDVDSAVTFVTREVPSGTKNGSNVTFTLANTPTAGTEEVYLNGILQNASGNDYSISGATITFTDAPVSTDVILVNYRY